MHIDNVINKQSTLNVFIRVCVLDMLAFLFEYHCILLNSVCTLVSTLDLLFRYSDTDTNQLAMNYWKKIILTESLNKVHILFHIIQLCFAQTSCKIDWQSYLPVGSFVINYYAALKLPGNTTLWVDFALIIAAKYFQNTY